ncbi:hypothetical protein SELMODRAFT_448813 [Selaginella moellendorffii]|uniref:RRM domain-containing protein n=1 Tax=Selaginella moellendorffii TaxID=88036 RepID=D8TAE1_SELML|nr:hypothetical protein SELMODRAFT_448813 [Selaginella moellendorffii]
MLSKMPVLRELKDAVEKKREAAVEMAAKTDPPLIAPIETGPAIFIKSLNPTLTEQELKSHLEQHGLAAEELSLYRTGTGKNVARAVIAQGTDVEKCVTAIDNTKLKGWIMRARRDKHTKEEEPPPDPAMGFTAIGDVKEWMSYGSYHDRPPWWKAFLFGLDLAWQRGRINLRREDLVAAGRDQAGATSIVVYFQNFCREQASSAGDAWKWTIRKKIDENAVDFSSNLLRDIPHRCGPAIWFLAFVLIFRGYSLIGLMALESARQEQVSSINDEDSLWVWTQEPVIHLNQLHGILVLWCSPAYAPLPLLNIMCPVDSFVVVNWQGFETGFQEWWASHHTDPVKGVKDVQVYIIFGNIAFSVVAFNDNWLALCMQDDTLLKAHITFREHAQMLLKLGYLIKLARNNIPPLEAQQARTLWKPVCGGVSRLNKLQGSVHPCALLFHGGMFSFLMMSDARVGDVLLPDPTCPPEAAIAAAQRCREAVSGMHNRGILHGDLVFTNVAVLRRPSGGYAGMLVGFSQARLVGPGEQRHLLSKE